MARPKTEDGKRITLSVKISERKAAAVDRKRGDLTRAAYLESLIDADLVPAVTRKTAPRRNSAPVAARAAPKPDAARQVPFSSAPDPCPHPKARVLKGLCGACGTHVG